MRFQNIVPKVSGLRCEIQICNHSGHDVLTTYDPVVSTSVLEAQDVLVKFWDDCISEFSRNSGVPRLKPIVNGRRAGSFEEEIELLDVKSPDFDLSLFEQITVLPFPLVGG